MAAEKTLNLLIGVVLVLQCFGTMQVDDNGRHIKTYIFAKNILFYYFAETGKINMLYSFTQIRITFI